MFSVRKLVLSGILSFCMSISTTAAPAYVDWTYMPLADGSLVEAALVGDESWHCYVTRDGRQMELGTDGRLVELTAGRAARMERQAARKAQSRKAPAARRAQTALKGERRQLVILVEYTDTKFADEAPLELWNRIFNTDNLSEGQFVGSVRDYFRDQSYGQFMLSFDLRMAHLNHPSAYYGGTDYYGDDEKVGELVVDAVKDVEQSIADWSPYDWDGDGQVDQVFILFAGKGQNNGGGVGTVWPQQWRLSEEGTGTYSVSSKGKTYVIDNFGCFAELYRDGGYGSFGTLCHEYGHCLGLPDFYYFSYVTYVTTSVVRSWDVMDYGLYNGGGFCPAGYSAHERWCLGWLSMKELVKPLTVEGMAALDASPEAYLLRNDGYSDEYYVLENRQKQGWDAALPGEGVLIFHIDYDEEVWHTGVPNSYSLERYSIVPANNVASYYYQAGWSYPYGSGSALNNSLSSSSHPAATLYHPNSDGNMMIERPITDITVSSGLAGFSFWGGAPSGIDDVDAGGSSSHRYYDLGGNYRGNSIDGLPRGVYVDCWQGGRRKVVKR